MNVEKIMASFGVRWSACALALCLLASTSMAAQAATFAVLQQPALPTAKAARGKHPHAAA